MADNFADGPLPIENYSLPQILASEKDFLVVNKPPRMHSAPLRGSTGASILAWCVEKFPEIAELKGRKEGEGGLLHRLDYETQGLILIARSRLGMESLLEQQREGKIIKEYSALSTKNKTMLPGFPLVKPELPGTAEIIYSDAVIPFLIKSAFRPYGPGRKAVRPVLFEIGKGEKPGKKYITEIIKTQPLSQDIFSLCIRITRGFRHQIRCHLAWLGMPILNDSVYGGLAYGEGFLGLRAHSLALSDPSTGSRRCYSIPQIELNGI